ncbi:C40 family peptidase [Tenacibaculum sp. IB213877]|uniref:C40 family peptidase n=1 Tax=Tenacibaculum sp. IB213877 TaxID=3097351 RepID=UPI002A5AB9F3|nr:C40 family peptidase [Tenacibaculum sp. IB213877]MDY0780679.1 C40 family peptidase [Tenacibaculum sp. IB213877]
MIKVTNPHTKQQKLRKVVTVATSFSGIPYKPGGTTISGMDCSGLIQTSYKEIEVMLPRSSQEMSKKGETITVDELQEGDLLFFDIDRLKGAINHVGLVTYVSQDTIQFIHSTTKRGVMVNTLNETYWEDAFVKAKRVL